MLLATFSGKDVRTAIFNSHHFTHNPVKKYVCYSSSHIFLNLISSVVQPKVFANNPQGTPNNRHVPLPSMKGVGTEFPVTTNQGGYQDGGPGRFRVITQTKRDSPSHLNLLSHFHMLIFSDDQTRTSSRV